MLQETVPPLSSCMTPSARVQRRAVISCALGNFLDLFDFTVFGFFALTIAADFFPRSGSGLALLESFATYGVGFLMRPLGAIVLGAVGDRYGRKRLLVLSILLMAVGTGGLALVPTYAAIGPAAPVLLVVCRLTQGFATGGEWGAAATFLVEYAGPGRRGLIGSLQQVGFGLGMICGTASAFLVTTLLTPPEIAAWGWRLPFAAGCLIGPLAAYIRREVAESPVFRATIKAHDEAASPLREAVLHHWPAILQVMGIAVVGTAGGYLSNIFLPLFSVHALHLPPVAVQRCTVVAAIIQTALMPVFGALSDRIGRKPVLLISSVTYLVVIYPLFDLLIETPAPATLFAVQAVSAILVAMNSGPLAATLCELFPTRVRLSALSIGYNIAVAVFGGFAPFISTFLVRTTGHNVAPTFYGMGCGLLTTITLLCMREPKGRALDPDGADTSMVFAGERA